MTVDTSVSLDVFMDRQERAYIEALLTETRGRVGVAAQRAGHDRRTFLRKLRKHGLDKAKYRRRGPPELARVPEAPVPVVTKVAGGEW